jgi:7-cyano-7-deazaguanine synthase
MKIVSLSSGGLDSSILLCVLKKDKHDVHPLFINYGQKSAKHEHDAFFKVCKFLELTGHVINLESLKEIRCGLTDEHISAVDFPYFPARNLILASVGASYAHNHTCDLLSLGFLQNSFFPDQSQKFVLEIENMIKTSLGTDFKVLTPFIDMNKKEVMQLAKKYDFPIDITYSCHSGTEKPCGNCMGCIERNKVNI